MERTSRIKLTDRAPKRFRITGKKLRRISPRDVAEALGAQVVGSSPRKALSPIGLIALREKVARMLQSTGGRPALEGSADRKKVPVLSGDWTTLERLAVRMAHEGTKASPGQLASLLLHEKIEELERHAHQSRPRRRRRPALK